MFLSSKNLWTALLALTLALSSAESTRIVITNNCSYTVWAAAKPGGGKLLHPGYTWTLPSVTRGRGRIWGRTDCGGVECSSAGRPPNTVVEYTIDDAETDTFRVSVAEGFNVPIQFGAAESAAAVCKESARCAADVNAACPMELRDPEGCNSPCIVFQNRQFCCGGGGGEDNCGPTSYSEFFEGLCPEAVTYPLDVMGKTRQCQTGIEYSAVFCPAEGRALPEYNPVFELLNNCSYTVWAAAVPGGSRRLEPGDRWFINEKKGTTSARIWGRTNCSFDAAGRGKCETGDCNGVFECTASYSKPPVTVAEYVLNQANNLDFLDISLVDGFNIPMEFVPTSNGCVRGPSCAAADVARDCPAELRAPGGCNHPCAVFKTNEYCCTNGPGSCGPTALSRFFKDRCPDAYSYAFDDSTSTFTCPGGTYYRVVFCP